MYYYTVSVHMRCIRSVHGKLHGGILGLSSYISVTIVELFLFLSIFARNSTYSIAFHRLPFDIDTTIRCIAMAIFQLYTICYILFIFLMILSFFFGVLIYTGAIQSDIKSSMDQIDQRSKSKDLSTETKLLEYCKTAIGVHARLSRY